MGSLKAQSRGPAYPPRVSLAFLPTPVEFLVRLSERLAGPKIYIKRDDLTGLAGGGNKTRKLEFLVAEAIAQNSDMLVTVGSAQSNHCRQTAAAAARFGMGCTLVLRGDEPSKADGNLLLNHLLGARVVWSGDREREDVMQEIVLRQRAAGSSPYPIPLGGSTPLGAAAYVAAMMELGQQLGKLSVLRGVRLDRIIFASSSGGTHAGMAAGAWFSGFEGEVLGISIDEEERVLQEQVAAIASGTCNLLGHERVFEAGDIRVNADYLGAGYGIMGAPEIEAIELFARTEGVLLDPVYTGRAAAAMINLIRKGVIGGDETILFWHTGGTPALWAYAGQLTPRHPNE